MNHTHPTHTKHVTTRMVSAMLLCLLLLAGIGSGCAPAAGSAPTGGIPSGAFTEQDLGVSVSGIVYYLREDSAPLLEALGDGFTYNEMISCVYDGMDKTYEYPGITVSTVPVGGKDIIEMITLTTADYTTLRGAAVGNTLDSLTALYGQDYFDDGYITYSLSGKPADIQSARIQFEFSGDEVGMIYIYSPSY